MKKIYETPEMEVSKFSLAADILTLSEKEEELENKDGGVIGGSDQGFGWGS